MLIGCCRRLFMSARFLQTVLLHSRGVVAERAVAEDVAVTQDVTVAEHITIAEDVAITEHVTVAKHVTIAEQQGVAEDDRSAKHRRTVTLQHVVTKRYSLDPHVEVQTLTDESFVDAIAQQEPKAIADLVLVDEILAGDGGMMEHEPLCPGESHTRNCG